MISTIQRHQDDDDEEKRIDDENRNMSLSCRVVFQKREHEFQSEKQSERTFVVSIENANR